MTQKSNEYQPAAAAAGRVLEYLERRRRGRGIDHEDIHAFDVSQDGGIVLRTSDLEAMAAALASPAPRMGEDNVLVPREVIAELFRFFHQSWEGTGGITEEGSHGRDLRGWRDAMSFYHRRKSVEATSDDDMAGGPPDSADSDVHAGKAVKHGQ